MKQKYFIELMQNDFLSVNDNKNPFSTRLITLTKSELDDVITQYSIFPKNIVSFLINSLYNLNFHQWNDVSNELLRNINEELGQIHKDDNNEQFMFRPHYVILRESILKSVFVDIKQTKPNIHTQNFLDSIYTILDSDNPSIVAGATFALECSAVPELDIVKSILNRFYELQNKPMPQALLEFFDFHINAIEIGHRDRFLNTCQKYILTNKQLEDFEKGFRNVLSIMDMWWTGLAENIS